MKFMSDFMSCLKGGRFFLLLFFSVFLAFFSSGCSKEGSSPEIEPFFSIKGQVLLNNQGLYPCHYAIANSQYQGVTDEQGNFAMELPLRQVRFPLQVFVWETGGLPYKLPLIESKDLPQNTRYPAINFGVIELDRMQVESSPRELILLSGNVRLPSGNDHSGIHVNIKEAGRSAITDALGNYSFHRLPEGIYTFTYYKEGFQIFSTQTQIFEGNEYSMPGMILQQISQAKTKMAESGKISGKIMLQTRDHKKITPPVGVKIRIENLNREVISIVGGRFEFDNVPFGNCFLKIDFPGFEVFERSFYLAEADLTLSEILLTENAGTDTGTVKGSVAFPDQKKPFTFAVLLGTQFISSLDSHGGYIFQEIPEGTYTLVIKAEGFQPAEIPGISVVSDQIVNVPIVSLLQVSDPPRVMTTIPFDGERKVPLRRDLKVFVLFNKKMNNASTKKAIRITPDVTANYYLGKEHQESDWDTLMILFKGGSVDAPLHFETTYTITIQGSAADMDGNVMEKDYVFSFETGKGRIMSSRPSNGEKNVPARNINVISFQFNCAIDRDSFEKAFEIRPRNSDRPMFSYSETEEGWTIAKVSVNLYPNTEYMIELGNELQTWDKVSLENTPFRVTFDTNEVKGKL